MARDKFRSRWALQFALAVTERDAMSGAPTKAICLMCRSFRRDETDGAKRQKRKTRVHCFSSPWRPDNMRRHLEQQHAVRWGEYQELSEVEKDSYFPVEARADRAEEAVEAEREQSVDTIESENAAVNAVATATDRTETFLVDRDIVEDVLDGVLMSGREVEGFVLQDVGSGDETDETEARYVVRVHSVVELNTCLKFLAAGLSIEQAAGVYRTMVEETTGGDGTDVLEKRVVEMCRIACAVNLQRLKDVLSSVWAFAVLLEDKECAGTSFLDVQIRFEHEGELHTVHLVAITARETSTDEQSSELVMRYLDIVAPDWRSQLIGVCSDGHSNQLPACARGIVDCFAEECVAPIFCDSSTVQKLSRVMHEACDTVFTEGFIGALMNLIGHLRRQQVHTSGVLMNTCPKLVEGSWKSATKALRWIVANQTNVIQSLGNSYCPYAPGPEWWVLALVVTNVMAIVDTTMLEMRAATGSFQDRECLTKLRAHLEMATGAMGPIIDSQLFPISCDDIVIGSFALNPPATISFLRAQGGFANDVVDSLMQSQSGSCQTLVNVTSMFVLTVITKLYHLILESDCDASACENAVTEAVPVHLPNALCSKDMRHQDFIGIMQQQRVRLLKRFSRDIIEQIEAQHRTLQKVYRLETHVRQYLDTLPTPASFSASWQSGIFGGCDCRVLRSFCGAFAAVVSNVTGSASSNEFALINWRKGRFSQSLTDFPLEAILHAQQYRSLSCFQE